MTPANTQPIRIRLDFSSLYQATAPRYSACFQVGAWFKRGLPAMTTPPSDGVETCMRGTGETGGSLTQGCWGKCLASDIIASADRQRLEEIVSAIVPDISSYLAVMPTDNLAFDVNQGAYQRALQSRGYNLPAACASDCTSISDVAVDPGYCNRPGGLANGYDVVLSVTKPAGIQGVAGTGSACAFDQVRRPLWIVLAWHSSIVGLAATSVEDGAREQRGFVRHEILHGLGFVNSMFFYARDGQGQRKNLIELRRVQDLDGATDEVWFFVRGRAYELAKTFFACDGNATDPVTSARGWDGLPLMGLPEAGRGAHWETRIMRDDVMSYGYDKIVSSITLAAMEDLGFYLANYSSAECMSWGYHQGCDYVTTRCGRGQHDRSAQFAPANTWSSRCSGGPGRPNGGGISFWNQRPNSYLASKCYGGNNPCSGASNSGYERGTLPDGRAGAQCDMQCYQSDDVPREGCKVAPSTAVEASTDVLGTLRNQLANVNWWALLVPAVWLVGGCAVMSCVRTIVCPSNLQCRVIAYTLSIGLWLVSAGGLAGTTYLYVERLVYAAFVNVDTLIAIGVFCTGLLLFTMVMIVALVWDASCTLRLGFWVLLVIVLAEVIGILFVCYWVYTLGGLQNDAAEQVLGTSNGQVRSSIDSFLARPMAVAEGLVCKTYQTCCRDAESFRIIASADATGTSFNMTDGVDQTGDMGSGAVANAPAHNASVHCLAPAQHEGATTDLILSLNDPSTENFCAYTSGAPPHLLVAPPPGACAIFQHAAQDKGFSLSQCQADFCRTGTDGYLAFLSLFVTLIREYAVPLAVCAAILVVIELILAVNLKTAAKHAAYTHQVTLALLANSKANEARVYQQQL